MRSRRQGNPKLASTVRGSPIAPAVTRSSTARTAGLNRIHIASIRKTPAARAASTTSIASASVVVKAFSTSTALPAPMAARARSRWLSCVVAT